MGKEISAYILITLASLVLLMSSSSVSFARAEAQTTRSDSIIASSSTFSSIPMLTARVANFTAVNSATNATTISVSVSFSSNNSTVSTSNSNVSASSNCIASTSLAISTSYTSKNNSDLTATITSTTTTLVTNGINTSGSNGADYSIIFSPTYWPCTDVSVTFTGPLVESGFYGDTLQFQYFQYSQSYPSVFNPIFTDPGLTVTSDAVNYWINYNEYAPVNFAYMPYIAVKVVDVTPKSNGYIPGQIFMELTNVGPEGYQSCQIASPAPIPEFQAEWGISMVSVALGLAFLQAHNHKDKLVRTKEYLTTEEDS